MNQSKQEKIFTLSSGEKRGRLTLLDIKGVSKSGHILWECLCECGRKTMVTQSRLKTHHTKSCGCLRGDPTYKSYMQMPYAKQIYDRLTDIKTRCFNKNCSQYKNYGKRGILICNEWLDFKNFYNWCISNGFKPDLTIERIDVNHNYSPDNCCFITKGEQSRNKTNTIKYDGLCTVEASKKLGGQRTMVWARIKRGWSLEKSFTTPIIRHDRTPRSTQETES